MYNRASQFLTAQDNKRPSQAPKGYTFSRAQRNLTPQKQQRSPQKHHQNLTTATKLSQVHNEDKIYNYNYNQHSFKMSRQECEEYLLKIKDSLSTYKYMISSCKENICADMLRSFDQLCEKVREEFMGCLENALARSRIKMQEQLAKFSNIESYQFASIKQSIQKTTTQIDTLLSGLQDQQKYRKSLSDTILKNFDQVIQNISKRIERAQEDYKRKIGIIKINPNYYNCITADIQKLFGVYRGFMEASQLSMVSLGESVMGGTGGCGVRGSSMRRRRECPECVRLEGLERSLRLGSSSILNR